MFRVTYRDLWESLARIRHQQGFSTFARIYRTLLTVCAFDNRGVLIPECYRVKR